MPYTAAALVSAPRDEVFAWHERPGALVRLTPPWLSLRVLSEAGSLRDGTAELAGPAGLRLRARHAPAAFRQGASFGDELVWPAGLGRALRWRHLHLFEDEGAGTLVVDRVAGSLPRSALSRMFRYRQAQLAGDLGSHARLAELAGGAARARPLTVALTGSSGLVGTQLAAFLSGAGHRVIRLVRRAAGAGEREWRPDDPATGLLNGVDVLVHLAGASIAGRFTAEHLRRVRDSRVAPTRLLAQCAAAGGVTAVVCASAIGYYGADRGDESLAEPAERGEGALAEVVAAWEDALGPARAAGIRTVAVRTGIVQSARGGTLALYRPLYAAGLGGRVAGGAQWLSWIGLDDLVDVYARAVEDPGLAGPVNAVAPHPVRGADYARTLARVLRRPALLPVPALAPRLLLGTQGSRELVEASQRVVPAVLSARGHVFRNPALDGALRHELGFAA